VQKGVKAMHVVVKAMRAHAGSAAVQKVACMALSNIAAGSDARTQAVVDAGALPLVLVAMRAHAGSAPVQLALEEQWAALAQTASATNPVPCRLVLGDHNMKFAKFCNTCVEAEFSAPPTRTPLRFERMQYGKKRVH
jgi:hypothetical protein